VRPCGEGILLETLRYEKEVKDSDEVFHAIPKTRVDKEMLSLAEELIGRKTAKFHPEKFKSHYKAALKELIDDKRKHGKITAADDEELEGGSNVIDLMDALRKSVSGKGTAVMAHAGKSSARKSPSSKSSGRKTPAKRKAPAKKAKAHPKRKAG
jgi:DNA end-binding protein Ku